MSDTTTEFLWAIANFKPEPAKPIEYRFYYDPVTKHGTRLGGTDNLEPFVLLTKEEFENITVAFTHYLSKSGKVKSIPVACGPGILLELSDTGPYRTLKDCMIFADQNGPDVYKLKDPDYD